MLNNNMLGFVHIPKNGGSSVKKWFDDHQIELRTYGHSRFDQVDHSSADWWFAVCRNPYQRVISYYEFSQVKAKRILNKNSSDERIDLHQNSLELYRTGFDNWLLNYSDLIPEFSCTQVQYINNKHAKINYVMKLENADREWRTLQIMTGVRQPLQTINTTQKLSKQYYTKTSQDFVYNMFRDDFDYFKYSSTL